MIKLSELNPRKHVTSKEQEQNLIKLCEALNIIRKAWAKPMVITSGLRSWEEHAAIYQKIGLKPPKFSAHLSGEAADVWDRDRELKKFCVENLPLLEKAGLYMEDPTKTLTWVHLQTRPPRSGNRIFLP